LARLGLISIPSPMNLSDQSPSLPSSYITKPVRCPAQSNPDDRGGMFLWNVGIHIQDCMVSQPRR
jgi:hypothetical protein